VSNIYIDGGGKKQRQGKKWLEIRKKLVLKVAGDK
jgi:hypothetical protein